MQQACIGGWATAVQSCWLFSPSHDYGCLSACLPCVLLQGPPASNLDMAVLHPQDFDAFGPAFCTPGTVQLMLGGCLRLCAVAALAGWRPASDCAYL